MDLFDDEELLAQMHGGNFMEAPDDNDNEEEEDLAHLREIEHQERKFKRVLQYPDKNDDEDEEEGNSRSHSNPVRFSPFLLIYSQSYLGERVNNSIPSDQYLEGTSPISPIGASHIVKRNILLKLSSFQSFWFSVLDE